jgi:hypothetical protein
LQPALVGGVAIGVLSALPVINIANCCCAWILFGGALAAYLMQQNHPEPIQAGDGAIVGLLAGLTGAFVWLILSIPIGFAMAPLQSRMTRRLLENASEMAPELRSLLEGMSGGTAVIGMGLLFGFFIMLFVSTLFGMLGGLFGALLFRTNPQVVTPPPIPPTLQ